METSSLKIIDECRKNFNKYTIRAFKSFPEVNRPLVLDMGCGTGVPTMALLEICDGYFHAIDSDEESLQWFRKKTNAHDYRNRLKIIKSSVFNTEISENNFDIILAEGLLNVIGFEKGLSVIMKLIRKKGYIILHDELKDDDIKKDIFKKSGLRLHESFELNENVWWDEYYACLEKNLKKIDDPNLIKKIKSEINEFKVNPHIFRSVYYVLQYTGLYS